jgi:hypothetical protein
MLLEPREGRRCSAPTTRREEATRAPAPPDEREPSSKFAHLLKPSELEEKTKHFHIAHIWGPSAGCDCVCVRNPLSFVIVPSDCQLPVAAAAAGPRAEPLFVRMCTHSIDYS